MLLSRQLDEREIALKKQQKIYFQLSSAGHEAISIAGAMYLRPSDWLYPYYRDRALCLFRGVTPRQMLLQALGSRLDSTSGGRMMPSHWGDRGRRIVSQSSPTGSQCLQAVGAAEANLYLRRIDKANESSPHSFESDLDIVYVSMGEGATSQGEFWESLNIATNLCAPVLFCVQDNGWAISVPVEVNTSGGSISELARGFPHMFVERVDGTDLCASCRVVEDAIAHCRAGKGPSLVHAVVPRLHSHSASDDDTVYRPPAERAAALAHDPLQNLRKTLSVGHGVSDVELQAIDEEVSLEIEHALTDAMSSTGPDIINLKRHIVADCAAPPTGELQGGEGIVSPFLTMAQSINQCLRSEMRENPRIVLFGEDVADWSPTCATSENGLKGKGGVFRITHGLQKEFGPSRVFNTPLAEASIMGRAIGYATMGMRPVVEIQFMDFIWPAMQQIRNELSVMRWRSNGEFSCPVVVRVAVGGYIAGGGVYHTQCAESTFTHIPGIHVVCPSNALDAAGLLRASLRSQDPVLFLEHKRLYRNRTAARPLQADCYLVPLGKAAVARVGHDLTLITYGALVEKSVAVAERIANETGKEVEVVDLRSLSPYDWPLIESSVKRCSRAIVAHEDMISWGYGAEIAARIAEELFTFLDAPVFRIGSEDCFVGYHPDFEAATLPDQLAIYKKVRAALEW